MVTFCTQDQKYHTNALFASAAFLLSTGYQQLTLINNLPLTLTYILNTKIGIVS